MTVYVDDVEHAFGRMKMCHMWADSRDELFAMADRIGVRRQWFQRPASTGVPGMNASWEHFDISLGKKAVALRLGAVLTDRFGPLEHCARLDIASGDQARRERGERHLERVKASRERRA